LAATRSVGGPVKNFGNYIMTPATVFIDPLSPAAGDFWDLPVDGAQ
jgi:hypothetical protein